MDKAAGKRILVIPYNRSDWLLIGHLSLYLNAALCSDWSTPDWFHFQEDPQDQDLDYPVQVAPGSQDQGQTLL